MPEALSVVLLTSNDCINCWGARCCLQYLLPGSLREKFSTDLNLIARVNILVPTVSFYCESFRWGYYDQRSRSSYWWFSCVCVRAPADRNATPVCNNFLAYVGFYVWCTVGTGDFQMLCRNQVETVKTHTYMMIFDGSMWCIPRFHSRMTSC